MKKCLFIITFLFGSLIVTKPVFAHFLASDRNVGAILHVDPNDDPIAGQVANFYFEIKDKSGKFTGQNCDCTFLIRQNNKQIYSVPLDIKTDQQSIWNTSVSYTFPQKDVYHVEVVGKPTQNNAFQNFRLQWDFRVDKDATAQSITSSFSQQLIAHLLQVALLAIVVIIIVLLIVKSKNKSKGHKHEN